MNNTKVVGFFLYLSKNYRYTLIRSTVQELWSLQVRVLLEISCFLDRSRYLGKFEIWAHLQWRTDKILNTKVIEHFITFLMRGRTQFWSRMKKLRPAEVKRHYKIIFSYFELISSFFRFVLTWIEWLSTFILFMHMHMQNHDTYRSYPFLTKRKVCPIYKAYI
jgi:hypothetical protein